MLNLVNRIKKHVLAKKIRTAPISPYIKTVYTLLEGTSGVLADSSDDIERVIRDNADLAADVAMVGCQVAELVSKIVDNCKDSKLKKDITDLGELINTRAQEKLGDFLAENEHVVTDMSEHFSDLLEQ